MNTECSSGQNCEHKRKGRCWFKHSGIINNFPQEGQGNQQHIYERPAFWCKFQDRCDRRGTCSFRHYDNVGQQQEGQGGWGGHEEGQGGDGRQGGLGGEAGHEEQGGHGRQEGPGGQGGLGVQGGQGGGSPTAWLPRLQCEQCAYQTNSQNELVYHMETRHKKANIQCDNCPNTFESSETLVSHIVRTHTKHQRPNGDFLNASFQENF